MLIKYWIINFCCNYTSIERNSVFKTWLKNLKNRKLKLCLLFGLNVFFNVLTFIRINYQYSKLKTYLVILFLSEWGYSVYIEIPLRLSPAPTFRALKIYAKLGIKAPLDKGDSSHPNEGPRPFARRNDYIIAKSMTKFKNLPL